MAAPQHAAIALPHSGDHIDEPAWLRLVPREQLDAMRSAADILARAGIEALLGGAFAIARHVERWRGTKDIDFFLCTTQRERAIDAFLAAGFHDYYETNAYDRSWIYRATRDDALVDLIWTLPNHVMNVDESWFEHAPSFSAEGDVFRTLRVEELIWIKLFVMQRDRCDWPDVINVLRTQGARLDWKRLLARVGDELPLLHAALLILDWLAPDQARTWPECVRKRFALGERTATRERADEIERVRVALLDSRPWYATFRSEDEPLVQ